MKSDHEIRKWEIIRALNSICIVGIGNIIPEACAIAGMVLAKSH